MKTKTMIGFDSRDGRYMINADTRGMVPPSGVCSIVSRPQQPFRGERLFVWSMTAPSFLVIDLRCGLNFLSASTGPFPAEMFATRLDMLADLDARFRAGEPVEIKISKPGLQCLGLELPMPLLPVGHEALITVENVSNEPARFVAGIYGEME